MITGREYSLLCKAIRATDYYVRYKGLLFNWFSPHHCPGYMYNIAEGVKHTEDIYATYGGCRISYLTNPFTVYSGKRITDDYDTAVNHGKNWKLLRRDIVEHYKISPKDIASAYPPRYKWPALPDICKEPSNG